MATMENLFGLLVHLLWPWCCSLQYLQYFLPPLSMVDMEMTFFKTKVKINVLWFYDLVFKLSNINFPHLQYFFFFFFFKPSYHILHLLFQFHLTPFQFFIFISQLFKVKIELINNLLYGTQLLMELTTFLQNYHLGSFKKL